MEATYGSEGNEFQIDWADHYKDVKIRARSRKKKSSKIEWRKL